MDSLTHIVFGAALGEVILGQKVGKKALWLGAIANSIPDLDVFLVFGDPIREITIHRGFSHSFLFPFLAAPPLAWLADKFFKDKIGFLSWFWFFFFLIITHPILDSLTTYGTQFFLPFSDYRVNFSSLFIIDFLFTIPLLAASIACWIAQTNHPKRKLWAKSALIISSFYVFTGFASKTYASHVFEQQLQQKGIETNHRMTGVTPFNLLLWYNVAEVDSGYFIGDYSLLDKDQNVNFSFIKRNEKILETIKEEYAINRLIWFSNGYFAVEKVGEEIRFFTLKFGTTGFDLSKPLSQSVPFYYNIEKKKDGKLEVETIRGLEKLELRKTLHQLFKRVMGNKEAFEKQSLLRKQEENSKGSG